MSTVSPQPMTINDVFQTVEQSGGGPQLVPSGVSPVWTEDTMAEDISRWRCPHEIKFYLILSYLMMILEYDREWAQ